MDNQTGHTGCAELLQKANGLLKAALHENKVKQLALDAFSQQQDAHQTHISSLNTIIQAQQEQLRDKDDRIASLEATLTLLEQSTQDQSAQLGLQQQLIDKLSKAAKQDQKKLERQDKELRKLESIRHGRNLLAKDKFGRRSEKTHTPPVIPGALIAKNMSEAAKARLKAIFDNTGYAVLDKKSRKCASLEAQGVPVEIIMVDVDKSKLPEGYLRIGENVTEKVVFQKARLFIRRYVQPVYLVPDTQKGETYYKNASEPMPASLLRNKCHADVTLIVQLLVDKYLYGMPIHRQNQAFEQAGAKLPPASMYDWTAKGCKALTPLYEIMIREMIKCGFIHMDETGLLVIDKTKDKGKKSHRGYLLAMINPVLNFACFKYAKGRGHQDIGSILGDFKGILGTDALKAYTKYGDKDEVDHTLCLTHGRRYFVDAKDCDLPRAKKALQQFINPLYAIERKCRRKKMGLDQIYAHRQKYAVPILDAFHIWLLEQQKKVIPRSAIAIAINYFLNNWKGLTLYVSDALMNIDNNVLERQIRTVAVTRKGFMFAGSHHAAQNAAIIYTFIASCKLQGIDPEAWLTDVLLRLPKHPREKLADLLPQNWKPQPATAAA